MKVSVPLARESYHAFFLAMRALHIHPPKLSSALPSIAPTLSFLAPAALPKASKVRPCLKISSTYSPSARWRTYTTLPQYYPAQPSPPKESENGDDPLLLDDLQNSVIPKSPPEIRKERRMRIRKRFARRYTGWANYTGYFSAMRGPTLIHRTHPGSIDTSAEYETVRSSGAFTLGKAISAYDMTVHLLSEGGRVQDIRNVWEKMDNWTRDFKLEDLVEWLVDTERFILAARIIEAIHKYFTPLAVGISYGNLILGNLELLRIPDDPYWERFRQRQALRLYALLKRLYTRPTPESAIALTFPNVQTCQFVAYHLARNLPPDCLIEMYTFLADTHIDFHTYTILHFIDRLAKNGDYYKGYLLITTLKQEGSKLISLLCRKAYTLLLSKATKLGAEKHAADILHSMSQSGLEADTAIYNVLIYNAIRNGNAESALSICKKMLEEGLRPNPVTFAHLFNLYKRTGDVNEQRNVIRHALRIEEQLSQFMCTDIVHAAFRSAPAERKFPETLETFQKLYAPGIPGLLGIAPKKPLPTNRILLIPDVKVTSILIMAFVNDETDPNRAWELYRRYLTLRDTQEFNDFFGTRPIIPNIFLKYFGSSILTIDKALEVMNELLSPSKVRWKTKIGPNQFSWSILAKAFAAHGRMKDSESIIALMKRQNYEVTEVTWTALLKGYLREGSNEQGGYTLGRMLEDSVGFTGRTLSLLSGVENNEDFMRGMDRATKRGFLEKPEPLFPLVRPLEERWAQTQVKQWGLEQDTEERREWLKNMEKKAEETRAYAAHLGREAEERRAFAARLKEEAVAPVLVQNSVGGEGEGEGEGGGESSGSDNVLDPFKGSYPNKYDI